MTVLSSNLWDRTRRRHRRIITLTNNSLTRNFHKSRDKSLYVDCAPKRTKKSIYPITISLRTKPYRELILTITTSNRRWTRLKRGQLSQTVACRRCRTNRCRCGTHRMLGNTVGQAEEECIHTSHHNPCEQHHSKLQDQNQHLEQSRIPYQSDRRLSSSGI